MQHERHVYRCDFSLGLGSLCPPKLGPRSSLSKLRANTVHYFDSQTETQDSSSQIHMYNKSSAYFGYHQQRQDLKAITRFQAFLMNLSSEVEDSASIARTHV
ncbi:hypothetical protein ACE6H2_019852 [Prunus campanulata]